MDDMHTGLFLFGVIFCHICFYFIDTLFKTCSHVPYLYFLKNTGLQIKFLRIHWFTTVFNRLIQKWGSFRPKLQLAWFNAGAWMAIGLMPLALALLIHSIYVNLRHTVKNDIVTVSLDSTTLQPMVPGINMPLSEIGYYMLTLLVCSIVHEFGHAIAAVREDARVIGIGMVIGLIVPVAYVSLEQVELLTAPKQLRILCAGIWHNVVLAMVATIIFFITPWILMPLYDWGNAVQVQTVEYNSPLYGPGGLQIRDRVTFINDCPITDLNSWQECLVSAVKHNTPGYCLQSEFIKEHDESGPAKHLAAGAVECCGSNSPRHLCFEYLESEDEPLELPQFSCLNVRRVVELTDFMCYKSSDCPGSFHCFRPSLENSTKLVLIKRSIGNVVIFLGHPANLNPFFCAGTFKKYKIPWKFFLVFIGFSIHRSSIILKKIIYL
uniref:Membrane-bound transcription factor site-2 protease n=1 Tax=Clastoptera arizonana TaxID=38151 RepID=A0A1B6E0Q3_9HEMI